MTNLQTWQHKLLNRIHINSQYGAFRPSPRPRGKAYILDAVACQRLITIKTYNNEWEVSHAHHAVKDEYVNTTIFNEIAQANFVIGSIKTDTGVKYKLFKSRIFYPDERIFDSAYEAIEVIYKDWNDLKNNRNGL